MGKAACMKVSESMTVEEYTDAVLAKLPKIVDDYDLSLVKLCIANCHGEGWPVTGTVSYCKCLEHVNPDLSEDYAVRRMSELRKQYCPIDHKMGWGGFGN